jgi:hypothetical protein
MPFKTLEPNHTQRQSRWARRRSRIRRPADAGLADQSKPSVTDAYHSTTPKKRLDGQSGDGRSSSTQPHSRPNSSSPERPGPRPASCNAFPDPTNRRSPFRLPLATNPLHHVQDACGGMPRRKLLAATASGPANSGIFTRIPQTKPSPNRFTGAPASVPTELQPDEVELTGIEPVTSSLQS